MAVTRRAFFRTLFGAAASVAVLPLAAAAAPTASVGLTIADLRRARDSMLTTSEPDYYYMTATEIERRWGRVQVLR